MRNSSLTWSSINLHMLHQKYKRSGQKKKKRWNSEQYETLMTFPGTKSRAAVRMHNSIQSQVCSTISRCWQKQPCVLPLVRLLANINILIPMAQGFQTRAVFYICSVFTSNEVQMGWALCYLIFCTTILKFQTPDLVNLWIFQQSLRLSEKGNVNYSCN